MNKFLSARFAGFQPIPRQLVSIAVCALVSLTDSYATDIDLPPVDKPDTSPSIQLDSLQTLSIGALRAREYQSASKVEVFSRDSCIGDNIVSSLPEVQGSYKSYLASFRSDQIRQYARITIPDAPTPDNGYPFVLFLHGWVGKERAPGYSIACHPDNLYYSELTDALARAGYAVLSPGYRGHGTVNGIPAEGLEFLTAFDQGAGLSTQFYAIDALNFVAGIDNIDGVNFPEQSFKFDKSQFFLVGHSQGGDAGLTYLAVSGEGKHEHLKPVQSALWSGTFFDRLKALEEVKPMALTPEAFLSGDGSWTGTAVGKNGAVNPHFIFGFPPDYIENPNPRFWSWQKETWSKPTVKAAVAKVTGKMYADLAVYVAGLEDIAFEIIDLPSGRSTVKHDPRIAMHFANIGGYNFVHFLQEPLRLHVPEKDYYSRLEWNKDLCTKVNAAGGDCKLIVYPHNNHSMRASVHNWFSPAGTPDGYPQMIEKWLLAFSKASDFSRISASSELNILSTGNTP